MQKRIVVAAVVSACLLLCSAGFAEDKDQLPPTTGSLSKPVAALIAQFPSESTTAGLILSKKLMAEKGALKEICSSLVPMGKGDDSRQRYAIGALTYYVTRPGAEAERKAYAQALVDGLKGADDPEVKQLFISQLRICGKTEAVPAIAEYLQNERLCDAAISALETIKDPRSEKLFSDALASAPEKCKGALILALGDLKSKKTAPSVAQFSGSQDQQIREDAAYVLANAGAPQAAEVVAKAVETSGPYAIGKANAMRLLYIQRLAEGGQKDKAAKLCRELVASQSAPEQIHMKSAALGLLVAVSGQGALEDLVKATDSDDKKYRAAALQFAAKMKGSQATSRWVKALDKGSTESKAEIVGMLGLRGDKAALPVVLASLNAPDKGVRAAAVVAAAQLGGGAVAPQLLAYVQKAPADEVPAVQKVLAYLPGEKVADAVAAAIPAASPQARKALLPILANRHATKHKDVAFKQAADKDESVRIAALKVLNDLADENDIDKAVALALAASSDDEKTAAQSVVASAAAKVPDAGKKAEKVLAAYNSADAAKRPVLLAPLSKIGGAEALALVVRESKSSDEATRDAAIRSLGNWSEASASPALLDAAKNAPETKLQVIALRGFIRLANDTKAEPAAKAALYRNALEAAKRDEDRQLVISGLADVKTTEAVALIAPFLDNENLKKDAALAIAKIVVPPNNDKPGMADLEIEPALAKAVPLLDDKDLQARAQKLLDAVRVQKQVSSSAKPDAEGFVSLFNGKDLSGWIGDTKQYTVEDGVIVCLPEGTGKIFTDKQYDDFVLRFDCKLTSACNNGIGIRTPPSGDPAYGGMEIQVLDDAADMYKELHPYQYHGSVYGVIPAERGHQKPLGEWNTEEIAVKGNKITVTLNGAKIVDGDLTEAQTSGTMDHKDHPGLKRTGGHIGLLGHQSRVEFRNLRIKELPKEAPAGFTALFNGKDLKGWKGLVENPIKRSTMNEVEMKRAQKKADDQMHAHWQAVDGVLVFDGQGASLCTDKDYKNFEMLVDWKITPKGDSGIYLRGSPQVQIWDVALNPKGSGGLYNNQKNTSEPLVAADNPAGEWNTFRIRMENDKVSVWLNDKLVTDNVVLENYWDRAQPIFPSGQIELQNHNSPLFFKNIYIKELP